MEDLVCKFRCYKVTGFALINDWYNRTGTVSMKPKEVSDLKQETLLKAVNDGGFGAQNIIAAKMRIYRCYEFGAQVFEKDVNLNILNPDEPVPEETLDKFTF